MYLNNISRKNLLSHYGQCYYLWNNYSLLNIVMIVTNCGEEDDSSSEDVPYYAGVVFAQNRYIIVILMIIYYKKIEKNLIRISYIDYD